MNETSFTLRVYGILLWADKVLIAHEVYNGKKMTKFPGGGLEYGEGTIDCLKREFREELNAEIATIEHYYTTDFFVASAFHHRTQVISIYYRVTVLRPENIKVMQELPHDQGTSLFEWMPLAKLDIGQLTFPIDRHVAEMLKN